jgi:hypothetical protein
MDAAADYNSAALEVRRILAEQAGLALEEYDDLLHIGFDEFYG